MISCECSAQNRNRCGSTSGNGETVGQTLSGRRHRNSLVVDFSEKRFRRRRCQSAWTADDERGEVKSNLSKSFYQRLFKADMFSLPLLPT